MDQQSSNSNMPRDTYETLNKIQKQGLSVSIVKNTSSASPASVENRPKQSVLSVEKTPKGTPITSRSQVVTENKAQILQARLCNNTDSRVSSGRVTTQATFPDGKAPGNQIRTNQTPVSEAKGFSPSWSGSSSSNEKSQGNVSSVVTTPVSKVQTSQARIIIPDNKIPVSRSNQSMLTENKIQPRITSGQRLLQNQHLIEGKTQTNQVNLNPTSPPDAKVFSNQVRTGQQFIISTDNKNIPVQRVVPQKSTDIKNATHLSINKQEIKTAQVNRMGQNVKVMSEQVVTQSKARQNYPVKADGKPNTPGSSPMIVENKMVRMVENVVDGNSTRTTQQCKSSTQTMRLPSNAAGSKSPIAVQTKMIYSTVHTTKMIFCQSVPGTPENKMILQGTQAASDVIQKTAAVFDMSGEPANVSTPARVTTPKRTANFSGSPVKKKCGKRGMTVNPGDMNNKSMDGNSPEDGNKKESFFSNLKTNRTGLTITPIRASVSSTPASTSTPVGVVRMPGEHGDKELYKIALEKAPVVKSPRGKARSRGRRKFVEPVCLTLSSDEEEEHMQAQFNNFEEAFAHEARMYPQESEDGSKSGQSSPAYPDENDAGCDDDPEFPGVTDIPCPRSPVASGSEEEEYEEREMDEMEAEEEEGMEEEEMVGEEELEESEMEEEEEDEDEEEEVPPEEEEEHMKGPLENIPIRDLPLRCRSVRIGSFKVHPKPNAVTLPVYLSMDGISFNAPMVSDPKKIINITLKPSDVTQMLVHFGKCLPIIFVITTTNFADALRKSLNMSEDIFGYYDPTSSDEKQKKITFLIDNLNEDQRQFLRTRFLTDRKVREVDQKTANEILVKSTPNQNQVVRCHVVKPQPQPQHIQISPTENLISVTTIQTPFQLRALTQQQQPQSQPQPQPQPQPPPQPPPPPQQPAVRLFTYPPPPQTGGIPITNLDLACLNEGEFLNDAIIDFYLKYIYNEKLSEYHREKTHIFSSYFFPRLTYKPERQRAVEEGLKNVQMRRHSQVKTWTRHVDIFSKDFIIIPVNQNVHWFLAIICYPGLVPEALEESPEKIDLKNNKSNDNVTSSDDQDENKLVKEASSTVDGNNQNLDENSTASSSSMFEQEEPDSEEPMPEAPDSSTHPDKIRHKKEVPCICIFDSLNGPNRSRIVTTLREYLEIEWKSRKGTRKVFDKTTMQGYIMQCPQQTNYSDCGVYVLQYVESFFESPLPYFDSPIPNLTNWFPKEKVAKKRQELRDLILNLQKKYSAVPTNRNTNASENVPSSQAQVLQNDNR